MKTKNDVLPDLIIEPGDSLTIPARLHQYNSVYIKKHGSLTIQENSSQWCILWVNGDVIIEGSLYAQKHKIGPRIVQARTPDEKTIEHEYNNQALGGTGGSGGVSRGGITNVIGGMGAHGTNLFGGGGGSPGGAIVSHSRGGSPGNNATDWRGAPPAAVGGYSLGIGGDGGRLSTYSNGGLLFIFCKKFTCSGYIYLNGESGIDGKKGSDGTDVSSPRGGFGGSGGGGGSAGGEGGKFVLVAEERSDTPKVLVSGGRGGRSGTVGRDSNGAQPGTNGEPGLSGVVDYYTTEQWKII